MRDEIKEQLSALVDDEARPDELRFLIRRLGQNSAMARQMGRYYLIRDVLHRDVPTAHVGDLGARIAAAIESEPQPRRSASSWAQRMTRPAAGLAIAASVAFSVVVVWPRGDIGTPPGPQQAAGVADVEDAAIQFASDQDASSKADTPAPVVRQWEQLDPQLQQKLNGLLVNHSEHSASGRLGSVLPYSRIAGHDEAVE